MPCDESSACDLAFIVDPPTRLQHDTGRLRQRSYETKEGEKRTVYELEADDIGVSLKNGTAKITSAARSAAGNGGQRPGRGRLVGQRAGRVLGRAAFLTCSA